MMPDIALIRRSSRRPTAPHQSRLTRYRSVSIGHLRPQVSHWSISARTTSSVGDSNDDTIYECSGVLRPCQKAYYLGVAAKTALDDKLELLRTRHNPQGRPMFQHQSEEKSEAMYSYHEPVPLLLSGAHEHEHPWKTSSVAPPIPKRSSRRTPMNCEPGQVEQTQKQTAIRDCSAINRRRGMLWSMIPKRIRMSRPSSDENPQQRIVEDPQEGKGRLVSISSESLSGKAAIDTDGTKFARQTRLPSKLKSLRPLTIFKTARLPTSEPTDKEKGLAKCKMEHEYDEGKAHLCRALNEARVLKVKIQEREAIDAARRARKALAHDFHVRPLHKLQLDRHLTEDAQIAANGIDIETERRPRTRPTTTSTFERAFRVPAPVTDVDFVEETGHVQLVGPPGYGAYATGSLWMQGAYDRHPRDHDKAHREEVICEDELSACSCKTRIVFEAITDGEYQWVGIAKTRKEARWVVHLAKEPPLIGLTSRGDILPPSRPSSVTLARVEADWIAAGLYGVAGKEAEAIDHPREKPSEVNFLEAATSAMMTGSEDGVANEAPDLETSAWSVANDSLSNAELYDSLEGRPAVVEKHGAPDKRALVPRRTASDPTRCSRSML